MSGWAHLHRPRSPPEALTFGEGTSRLTNAASSSSACPSAILGPSGPHQPCHLQGFVGGRVACHPSPPPLFRGTMRRGTRRLDVRTPRLTWTQLLEDHQARALPDKGLGDWPHGWQHHAMRTRNSYFRVGHLGPGPRQGLTPEHWLRAFPGRLWAPCSGMPAHRACMGQSGARNSHHGPGMAPDDQRRLDMVIYGVTPRGGALCCDATLVFCLSREGLPQSRLADEDGAALAVAERRKQATYPEPLRGGPQRPVVLGAQVGGRWGPGAQHLVRDLVRCVGFELRSTRRGHGLGTPLVDAAVRGPPARDGAVGRWAGLAGNLSRSSGRSASGACAGPLTCSGAQHPLWA